MHGRRAELLGAAQDSPDALRALCRDVIASKGSDWDTPHAMRAIDRIICDSRELDEIHLKALKHLLRRGRNEQAFALLVAALSAALPHHTALAASCLVSLVSAASATMVRVHTQHIISSVEDVLQGPATPDKAVLACLRLLSVVCERTPHLSAQTVASLAQIVPRLLLPGNVASGSQSNASRLRVPRAAEAIRVPSARRRRLHSTGSATGSDGSSSSEAGERSLATISAPSRRLEALKLLRHLAKSEPVAFRDSWPLFLPFGTGTDPTLLSLIASDASLAVRKSACETLSAILTGAKPFLAIAQVSDHQAAFTSISARVAYLVIEVHRTLAQAMYAAATHPPLVLELLRAVCVLSNNVTYARFSSTDLISQLLPPILQLFDREGDKLSLEAIRAYIAVVEATPNVSSPVVVSMVEQAKLKLNEVIHHCDHDRVVAAWDALAASHRIAPRQVDDLLLLAQQLAPSCGAIDLGIRLAQLRYARAIARDARGPHVALHRCLLLAGSYAETPETEVAVCEVLADASLAFHQAHADLVDEITLRLCISSVQTVAAAAFRALAFQARSQRVLEEASRQERIFGALEYQSAPLAGRAWALAGVLDTLVASPQILLYKPSRNVLQLSLKFAARSADVSTRCSGLRATGAAVKLGRRTRGLGDLDFANAIKSLTLPLRDTTQAKVQWNTLAALHGVLLALDDSPIDVFDDLLVILLTSSNLKVRLAAIPPLLLCTEHHASAERAQSCLTASNQVLDRLIQEEKSFSFGEMVHAKALREAEARAKLEAAMAARADSM